MISNENNPSFWLLAGHGESITTTLNANAQSNESSHRKEVLEEVSDSSTLCPTECKYNNLRPDLALATDSGYHRYMETMVGVASGTGRLGSRDKSVLIIPTNEPCRNFYTPLEQEEVELNKAWLKTKRLHIETWNSVLKDGGYLSYRTKTYHCVEKLMDDLCRFGDRFHNITNVKICLGLRGGMKPSGPTKGGHIKSIRSPKTTPIQFQENVIEFEDDPRASPSRREGKERQQRNTTNSRNMRNHIQREVDRIGSIRDEPEIIFYEASAPRFEKDKAWRNNPAYGKLENQASYWAYSYHSERVVYKGIYLESTPVGGKRNLLSAPLPQIDCTYLLPKLTFWSHQFEYGYEACRNGMKLRWNTPRGIKTLYIPHQLKRIHSYDLFDEVVVAGNDQPADWAYVPDFVVIEQMYFESYEVQWAQQKGYSISNISQVRLEAFLEAYNQACNVGMITNPDPSRALILWKNIIRELTSYKYDTIQSLSSPLEQQRAIYKSTSSQPDVSSIRELIKRILFFLLPKSAAEFVNDSITFLGKMMRKGYDWVIGQAQNMFLHAFRGFHPVLSAALEEILKTVPFGSLIVTFMEMKAHEWSLLGFVKAMLVHAPMELLTLKLKLFSLPIRIALHCAWNFYWSRMSQNIELHHEILRETIPMNGVVKGGNILRVPEQDQITPIDPIFDTFEPFDRQKAPINNIVSSMTPMFAAQYTRHNMLNSIMFRNKQPYEIKKVPYYLMELARSCLLKVVQPVPKLYTSKEWILLENHSGGKVKLYTAALEKYEQDGEIYYTQIVDLKYDEVLPKQKFRTIIAFDNSYVVNAAPIVYSVSKMMQQEWDGRKVHDLGSFKIILLYASGVTTKEIAKLVTEWLPHRHQIYFLAVLGDDSLLLHKDTYAASDFSRYDSTQVSELRELFHDVLRKSGLGHYSTLFKTADSKAVTLQGKNPIKFHPNGLRTGCPQTSVSNSLLTAAMYMSCIQKKIQFNTSYEDTMKRFGMITKWNFGTLSQMPEFLKTGFLIRGHQCYPVPLLGKLFKFGKFMRPTIEMIKDKSLSPWEQSRAILQAQFVSMGNFVDVPYWKDLYAALLPYKASTYFNPNIYSITYDGDIPVSVISEAYMLRYDLCPRDCAVLFSTVIEAIHSDHKSAFWYAPEWMKVWKADLL